MKKKKKKVVRKKNAFTFFQDYLVPHVQQKDYFLLLLTIFVGSIVTEVFLQRTALEFLLALASLIIVGWGHEIGHTVAMGFLGYRPRRLVLDITGGNAGSSEGYDSRRDSFIITLMGPVFGLGITLIFLILHRITGNDHFALAVALGAIINLYNLLPVVPMDGGQILSELGYSLSLRYGYMLLWAGMIVSAVVLFIADYHFLMVFIVYRGVSALREMKKYEPYQQFFIPMPKLTLIGATFCYVLIAGTLFQIFQQYNQRLEFELNPVEQTVSEDRLLAD